MSFTATLLISTVAELIQSPKASYPLEALLLDYPASIDNPTISLWQRIILAILAICIGIFTVHFVGKHSSNILKRILGRLYKKPTASSLFFAKILIITISFLFIVILLLALPTFAALLPVITGGSVVAIVCFSIQHLIARRSKMPYKKIA